MPRAHHRPQQRLEPLEQILGIARRRVPPISIFSPSTFIAFLRGRDVNAAELGAYHGSALFMLRSFVDDMCGGGDGPDEEIAVAEFLPEDPLERGAGL